MEVSLYDGLRQRKIAPLDENARVATIETDLRRDSATKELKYVRQGAFKVNWRMNGDLLRSRMVTFVRRNEPILILKYTKTDDLITVQATPISDDNAKNLAAIGLNVQGQLRVKTDAQVVRHNAGRVLDGKQARQKLYVWDVKGLFDPTPKIVITLR